jgi:hypothetical protein
MQSQAQGDQAMQVQWDLPVDEESIPAEQELTEIDAFIEAQLRTGVLLVTTDTPDVQAAGGLSRAKPIMVGRRVSS